MKILGIDPGTATTGFGVVDKQDGKLTAVDYGVISTPADMEMGQRLVMLADDLDHILGKHQPDVVAVEKLFFAANVTTAMAVSQARGVVLYMLAQQRLVPVELTPLQVKQAVAGDGQARKRQIQEMVKRLLKLDDIPKPDDAADALALAIAASNPMLQKQSV
jgi:crossover junction endodeoxyribonuclease RuvC